MQISEGLPKTQQFRFSKPPEGTSGQTVEFRLIYRGSLPAQASGRPSDKHAIRKQIHSQLATLWHENHVLSHWLQKTYRVERAGEPRLDYSVVDQMVEKYKKFGFNFVPLVTEELGISCSLEILFLRRDAPGKIFIGEGGGDLDNRIKVLFDGLRMPRYADEVRSMSPEPNEDPFYCLLEDDTLINEVKVSTDRLLTPIKENEDINDVVLVIHVKTIVVNSNKAYIEFYT